MPQPKKPAIPPIGEQSPKLPQTLVEAAIVRCDERLYENMKDFAPQQMIPLAVVVSWMESNPSAIAHAAEDLGYFGNTGWTQISSRISSAVAKGVDTNIHSTSQPLTQDQVFALNEHPFTHSVSMRSLASILDVSIGMIKDSVATVGITPVLVTTLDPNSKYNAGSLLDLDQIEVVKAALVQFAPPEGYIAESKVLASMQLATAALRDIMTKLEIGSESYHNFEAGRGEPYLSELDTIKILTYVRDKRRGKKQ